MRIERGDITAYAVDAVVNAANSALSGGGGVDGAIHLAAGPGLLAECRLLGRCAPGDAVITKAYGLAARFVIHAVGPVWQGGGAREAEQLASCYRESFRIASAHDCKSVAFPAISCGAYRNPLNEAASIAVETLADCQRSASTEIEVIFVCFDQKVERSLKAALAFAS